jgi:hypothetical protein
MSAKSSHPEVFCWQPVTPHDGRAGGSLRSEGQCVVLNSELSQPQLLNNLIDYVTGV